MSKRLLLIRNPASAASRDQAGRLERMLQALSSRGHPVESALTRRPGQAIELARQAANVDLVVAVGGDGTVNEVASGLLQRGDDAPLLGILPFGTGNDIAQLVRTGDDAAFLGALDSGSVRHLDMMSVQCQGEAGIMERAAILFAAVGFASELLRQTTPRVKRWFGPKLCYSVGFFRALLTYRTPRVHLRSGDIQVREPMLVAYAANAPHAGGGMMQLAPDASMEDGLLNLSFILQASRWEAATQFPRLLKGTHIGHPKVRYFKGTELELHADEPLEVAIDGEIVGRTPATIRLRPRALRVLGS